jgi:polysaccharide chain length determinant protein (PEP-CTERM system associated)
MESLQDMLARYGGLAWRRRWWGVGAAWVLCLLGWVGVASLPNQYEASARVYINADAVLTPLLKGIAADSAMTDQIDLLQHMLLSRPNLEKIIAKTDLQLETKTASDMERMVAKLGTAIKVDAQAHNIFSIAFRNPDRQLAYDVVQAVLASYIENRAGDNRDDMEKASEFLEEQIASYEKKLRDAEHARADFRTKYIDLLPADGGGINRLEQARNQVTALTGQLADLKSRRTLLAKELASTPEVVVTEAGGGGGGGGGDTSAELRAAENRLRELQQVYTDQYPEVVSQKRTVESLRAAASGSGPKSAGGGKSAPNPVYEQLKLRLVDADASIESLQRQIDDANHERDRLSTIAHGAPNLEARYINLNRDYEVLRGDYDELLKRREEMRIATAAQVRASNVKMVIIDPPQVPQYPVAPPRILLSIGVLIASLAGGVGVVGAMLALDQSFHSVIDLRAMGRPVIGAISLAALPPTLAMRLRHAAVFGSSIGLMLVALGGVLLHYLNRI